MIVIQTRRIALIVLMIGFGPMPAVWSLVDEEFAPLTLAGIENAYRAAPGLYSGGQPTEEGFRSLSKLGVKTIISVDGSKTDVEAARRYGMRYVHLPVGYDGIGREQSVRIVKAARMASGPVFVHCHHGKHRGPAAMALVGIANRGWGREQAQRWLKTAGTSPSYQGLYRTVERFRAPTVDDLKAAPGDLPEQARVEAMVELMVQVDERWDALKAIKAAGYRAPKDHPDLVPAHEALMIVEHFRESARLKESQARGEPFLRALAEAERDFEALRQALADDQTRDQRDSRFERAAQACVSCHSQFRDRRGLGKER